MRYFQPKRYFWKILSTIGVVSIVFQIITLSTLAYFMVIPLGQRATEDLSNVMIHAAETWYSLPLSERRILEENMETKHALLMTNTNISLNRKSSYLPYLFLLENSLCEQTDQVIEIKQSRDSDGEDWFWADIPVSNTKVRFGFPRSRIGVNPPLAFFLLITIGLFLTVITAVKLTRRLTVPVEQLHKAAQAVGKGQWPAPVKIDEPEELAVLANEFNRMNVQVRELLSNRTTLLAGISHDLRTPLTQIQLALSMLPNDGGDSKLMHSIQDDLQGIDRLIGETLSISLELEEGKEAVVNIGQELKNIIEKTQKNGANINLIKSLPCSLLMRPLALRRIVTNLLINAVRYGDHHPIEVTYTCSDKEVVIEIMDQGPGIPPEYIEAVFRPFYRLEKSRGTKTGGSGLGLAIVRQLADANNWSVKLIPRNNGGTRAVLIIPYGQFS